MLNTKNVQSLLLIKSGQWFIDAFLSNVLSLNLAGGLKVKADV